MFDLNFSDVESGNCRVYFKTQKNKQSYCLQDEGEKFGGMRLYRCTDNDWREPSHEPKFSRIILFERPKIDCELTRKAVAWIDKYESDFKESVSEVVSESDEPQ